MGRRVWTQTQPDYSGMRNTAMDPCIKWAWSKFNWTRPSYLFSRFNAYYNIYYNNRNPRSKSYLQLPPSSRRPLLNPRLDQWWSHRRSKLSYFESSSLLFPSWWCESFISELLCALSLWARDLKFLSFFASSFTGSFRKRLANQI